MPVLLCFKQKKTFQGVTVLPRHQLPFYVPLACQLFVLQKTDAPIFFLYYALAIQILFSSNLYFQQKIALKLSISHLLLKRSV